jgi:putative transposase
MQTLYENMVVEWYLSESEERYIERILWISPSNDVVFSIAMEDDKAFPIMKTFRPSIYRYEAK